MRLDLDLQDSILHTVTFLLEGLLREFEEDKKEAQAAGRKDNLDLATAQAEAVVQAIKLLDSV